MKKILKKLVFGEKKEPRKILFGVGKGVTFVIDTRHKTQRLLGLDEYEIAPLFRDNAKKSASFVDIGTADGYYVALARHFNSKITCVGCEPQGELLNAARRNAELNFDDTEFVEWKNQAVGSKSDQVSLDEVCKDLPRPILIKVDVDGFELDVLESGRSTLEEGDCCLILETHSQELESSCLDLLKSLGKSVKIIPNGRMRFLVPERRPIPHNRWAYAK